ncbi:MAG TPA: preprotein translocase subunit SecE [Cytophagales bacterium]|nr:preprotein translocase subunit SecE [Cytophagales bacterium]HAA23098.1 preprotein translocase subunit SecE [Cytophagales bacterium]HAP61741.1 preprotein translocase subunit SecE [Cytophagales bacterium]
MNKFIAFVRESIDEMRTKVTWPKYRDLQQSSILVLVASLIFALVIGLIDYGFQNLVDLYYGIGDNTPSN